MKIYGTVLLLGLAIRPRWRKPDLGVGETVWKV
jgi:hypothetical protein